MYQNEPFTKRYTWEEAQNYAHNLSLGGYDDWRLPTIEELSKIKKPHLTERGYTEPWNKWIEKNKNILKKDKDQKYYFFQDVFLINMPKYSFFWCLSKGNVFFAPKLYLGVYSLNKYAKLCIPKHSLGTSKL